MNGELVFIAVLRLFIFYSDVSLLISKSEDICYGIEKGYGHSPFAKIYKKYLLLRNHKDDEAENLQNCS